MTRWWRRPRSGTIVMPEVKLPEGFEPPSAAVIASPKLNRIEVRRDDLACALKCMTVDGTYTQAVKDRLTAALFQYDGSLSPPSASAGGSAGGGVGEVPAPGCDHFDGPIAP